MKTISPLIAPFLFSIVSGSWLTCPASFNTNPLRKPETAGPCEADVNLRDIHTTYLYAGDRLKVGWVSNNHAGGYVRLALVSLKQRFDHEAFDKNIIKVTCFGYDNRAGNSTTGFCNHPCNARGGCEYQTSPEDINRYDTTIAIPTNLDTGYYVLQWKAIVADLEQAFYSCSLLHIQGGSSRQKPCNPPEIHSPSCVLAPGGVILDKFLFGNSMGSFCFDEDESTNVDVNLGTLARNYNCDPRQSCQIAISPDSCRVQMKEPLFPRYPLVECPHIDKGAVIHGKFHPKKESH